MTEVINPLIRIIKDFINQYEEKLANLKTVNTSVVNTKYTELANAQRDINELANLDLETISKVLEESPTPYSKKTEIYSYLSSIQQLLKLNKKEKTTYKLADSQLQYIDEFYKEVDQIKNKNRMIQNSNITDIGILSKKYLIYKNLLEKLEDSNNREFLIDFNLINDIFKNNNISLEKQEDYLLSIMKYNREVENNIKKGNTYIKKIEKASKNDYQTLLEKYGYDFNRLGHDYGEAIVKYASISNVAELLKSLDTYNYPKFSLPNDGLKLTTILINSNKDTFDNITSFSSRIGLTPKDLLTIIPVLIPPLYDIEPSPAESELISTSGKSDEYLKNIKFLEEKGFDILEVFKKCSALLVMPNNTLRTNYQALNDYGFTPINDENNLIIYPSLSALLATDFTQIIDQFIEVLPEGYEFIKNNFNVIGKIPKASDIIFYNIYASNMSENEYGIPIIAEGPFINKKANPENLRLRGEITRFIGSGYERIPYREIEEDNKKEKTKTYEPPIKNKDKFQNVSLSNITKVVNEELSALEKYTDKTNKVRYNFNGTLISKQKVKRIWSLLKANNLDTLEDSLLYAITYNSIINEEDFNKIKDIINS